jgi:GNAT superfamily N-acetyltransferase
MKIKNLWLNILILMEIITYQPEYKTAISDLIINIQRGGFNVPITLSDQPDLADIPNFYQIKNGNFWIAVQEEKLIGTIALIDIGNGEGCIRKMFIHKDFRGKETGIAQQLLNTLMDWSKIHGIHSLYLGTIERLYAARRFYERNGFTLIEKENLPETFPIMAVDTLFYQSIL